ncbi:MAG: SDR family oxidoreductase [Saprospiraceae bacterium]
MTNYYSNKIIWITGASSGIGRALAIELSSRNATVLLSSRNREELKITQSLLSFPENSYVLQMDMTNSNEIKTAFEEVISKYGKVDVLINNAGLSQRSKILDTNFEVYRKLMEVNYFGTIYLSKLILPEMIKQGSGQIIVLSSLAGKLGASLRSGYSAAKHALHGFFDCLRVEHQKDKIKVNIVCPGFTKTNIARNAMNESGQTNSKKDTEIENGMDPNLLAIKILNVAEANKFESYFGGKEKFAVLLKRFFPKLLHRILVKNNK